MGKKRFGWAHLIVAVLVSFASLSSEVSRSLAAMSAIPRDFSS